MSSVLRPHQHSIGYMGDGFYRSKDPTNSIKVLKENLHNGTNDWSQNAICCWHYNANIRGMQLLNLSGYSAIRSSLMRSFSGPSTINGRVYFTDTSNTVSQRSLTRANIYHSVGNTTSTGQSLANWQIDNKLSQLYKKLFAGICLTFNTNKSQHVNDVKFVKKF